MDWNNIKDNITDWIAKTFLVITILAVIGGIVCTCNKKATQTRTTTSPVEGCLIDSILVENDKLIIEVEHLDSIKNAKIIEVKSLDNDSTLRLFYQLIGK